MMTLLSAAAFPHRAAVRQRVRTLDSLGGSTDSFTLVYSDLPCWKQLATEREVAEYEKRGFHVTDKIYFLQNYELGEEHILQIDGETFEVVSRARPDASAGKSVVWRVMARISSTGST